MVREHRSCFTLLFVFRLHDRGDVFQYSLSEYSTCQALFSTPHVALHSGLLPSVFGCMGHVCKLALRPDVVVSVSSNIIFVACFDDRCVPSQVAPVSTPQVALHSGLLLWVFGCMGHVCKLPILSDVAAWFSLI